MADTRATDRRDHEQRIRELAYHLWEQDGRPHGRDVEFWQRARELVAIEENPEAGLLPNPMSRPATATGRPEGVEEAEIQANYGEFPNRFTDQGERPQTPMPRQDKRTRSTTVGKSTRSNSRSAGKR
jgi:Protein of unknown function (DUF2934)